MTMQFSMFWLKTFQTANFLAACLLLFEILAVVPHRWRSNDWSGPVIGFTQLCIGAFALSATILMASLPRLYNGTITWLDNAGHVPVVVNLAALMLFSVVFWFHHYVRKENNEGTLFEKWRTDHLPAVIIMGVSVAANVAELAGG